MNDYKESWFNLYRAAILKDGIERAQGAFGAVKQRYAELKGASVISIGEWRQLQSAQHTLELLLRT